MEEEASLKPSVAQLAGLLQAQSLPVPGNVELKPMRRSLVINDQKDEGHEEKSSVCPHPAKLKLKSSPLIEKLQANLALSPTVLLTPPKSPESKQPPPPACCPVSPCVSSTLQPSSSCEDEAPVSFEQPVKGTPLPCFNKSRARLSFKRRLPSRQHRKSASEETKVNEGHDSPCEGVSQEQNGEEVHAGPLQEDTGDKTDSAQATNGPQQDDKDRTEDRDEAQTHEETEVRPAGDEEEKAEPSDCQQAQEEEKEETEEDRTEVKEDAEKENEPEEK